MISASYSAGVMGNWELLLENDTLKKLPVWWWPRFIWHLTLGTCIVNFITTLSDFSHDNFLQNGKFRDSEL